MRGVFKALLWTITGWGVVNATYAPYLPQSFFFEWDTNPYPIPVAAQCQVLNITWSRGTASGPNNVGPYYLQIYTSIYPTPFIINTGDVLNYNWAVPFPPNTIFQICMFDKNGNTGGCQRTVTVIPATTTPSCTNVTFPATSLDVTGAVLNGPFSQYGWIPQCSDLQLKPNNGTPPYTYTIATTLHPPYNITSNNMNPVNWTVALSWGSSFFVSVVDSAGNTWSRGLLHSGSSDDPKVAPTCLSQISANDTSNSTVTGGKSNEVKPVAAAGAGIGGIVAGILLGLIPTYLCMRGRVRKAKEESDLREKSLSNLGYQKPNVTITRPGLRPLSDQTEVSNGTSLGNRGTQYQTEPFTMPSEVPLSPRGYLTSEQGSIYPATEVDSNTGGSRAAGTSQAGGSSDANRNNVYVVHHDGGRAPVTVFTPGGAQVVELPPQYAAGASSDAGVSNADSTTSSGAGRLALHNVLEQTREVASTPRKGNA